MSSVTSKMPREHDKNIEKSHCSGSLNRKEKGKVKNWEQRWTLLMVKALCGKP